MGETDSGGRIHILPPETSRRIAAGEVIDRPFSIVRELVDNSVDADASEIVVRLSHGGLESISVSDDGSGMSKGDLSLCYQSHATSKIGSVDDLDDVRTLGFRGEALSSIANVARLEITSAVDDSGLGHRVSVRGGRDLGTQAVRSARGTTVTVSELFFNLPARKKFLRGASTESNLCRTALVDTAVAHPTVAFRLFVDGTLRLFLPPAERSTRIASAYERLVQAPSLHTIGGSSPGVEIEAIVADPSVDRTDRKLIQVYTNGRRIWEYAFTQGAEYAFSEFLPGGRFPIAFIFLSIDPQLVDFNVHPAKKEARFQNRSEIRRRIVDLIRGFLTAYERCAAPSPSGSLALPYDEPTDAATYPSNSEWSTSGRGTMGHAAAEQPSSPGVYDRSQVFSPRAAVGDSGGIRYLGQIFDLFLVAQRGETLYIVDQHAAHERILFERARQKGGIQQLLVPIVVEVSDDRDRDFVDLRDRLETLGFELSREGHGRWQVTAVPTAASALSSDDVAEILESLDAAKYEQWEWDFYAQIACKSAVKDGATLDAVTALELLRAAFALPNARCPHGRPIWFEVTRDELFRMVGRT